MNRSALHSLTTILMFVAACPTLAAAQTLVVQVDNDARIPAADLAQMEEEVGHSFHAIGVQVVWEHSEVPLDDTRGLRVHLRLLSRAQADRKIMKERIGNAVLGQTNRPARLVYIFTRRIVEASVKFSRDYTRIVGLVVAHELGHALLPAGSHSDSGVMNGRANLWGKIAHEFTPEEGDAIRAELRVDRPIAPSPDQLALSRLRSSDAPVGALIARATEQSATFRGLVEAISSSDGIVYVEPGECGHEVTACLVTVTAAGAYRMLWIKVDTQKADCDLIVSIGHELRHAVEVLTDSDARSGIEMFLYYLKIARRGAGPNLAFETTAAIDAGIAVRSEIQACRAG
jgi:hypothetical protein